MKADELFRNIENYLKAQKEIYGDTVYIDFADAINNKSTVSPESAESNSAGFGTDWINAGCIDEMRQQIISCPNCALSNSRKNLVFGTGNPKADIMIIGEAPGADEDVQGKPFVGRAGQLLTKMLEAINLDRERDCFIANILKCRPPNNRDPLPAEVEKCEPYLIKQIELIKPEFILALGRIAANTLLKSKYAMGDIRGKLYKYQDIKMLVTYHPAALLRNPEWKKAAWEDLKYLRKLYDEFLISKQ